MADNTLALQVQPTQFGQNVSQGYSTGLAQMGEQQRQEAAAFEQFAAIGLGVMDGNPDGAIDPAKLDQALGLMGNSPIAAKLKENPELLRTITKGSMNVLQFVRDGEKFEMAKRQFEQELAAAQQASELKSREMDMAEKELDWKTGQPLSVSAGETLLDPETHKPIYTGAFKPEGGADGSGETWFGSVVYMRDPKTGKVVAGQVSNFGNFKPIEGDPAVPVQQLNTETGFVPRTKFGDVPTNAPETPINNEVAAHDTAVGKGKGELEVEKPALARKAAAALSALERQQGIVSEDIDKAISAADSNGLFTTGLLGDLSKSVPGTPAYDLAQTLLTIQANIGFDRLQEMRNNSPTGGALGAISDKETALLQAVNGALAQGQSKDQFKANLDRIKTLMTEVLAERKTAFATDFGGTAAPAAGDTAPAPADGGDVIDWTEMDWGD